MSCGRPSEVDWAAVAADPGAPEWAELRDHYPRCPDCTAEMARWSQLRALLAASGADAHPAEADLLAFQRGGGLEPARRAAIEAHRAACAPCRTELAVLRGFDFDALPPPRRQGARAREPGAGERLRALAASLLARPRPALALALLLGLALPVGLMVWWALDRSPAAPPPIAREAVPDSPATGPAPARAPDVPDAPPRLAERPPPPAPEVPPAPPPQIAAQEIPPAPSPQVAAEQEPPAPEEPAAVARVNEAPPAPAERLPEEPPRYAPRIALAGGSFDPARGGSVVRGTEAGELPALRALGPEHVGATATAAPTLYWHLSGTSRASVELSLIDGEGIAPLVERRVAAPVSAGLHAFDLGSRGVALAPGVTYTWFAVLVPDPDRREADVISRVAVRYTPPSPALRERLARVPEAERGHVLAAAGYWYDAFHALAQRAAAGPEAARAATHRDALLEQAGLGAIARTPAE